MFVLVYVPEIRFKITRVICAANHVCIGGRCDLFFPGWDINAWRVCLISFKLCLDSDLI